MTSAEVRFRGDSKRKFDWWHLEICQKTSVFTYDSRSIQVLRLCNELRPDSYYLLK